MALIGETVRSWRRELGLTQSELADRMGVAQNHVSAIETGKLVDPQASTVEKLARAFGVTVDELLAGVRREAGGLEYQIVRESYALREMAEKWSELDHDQQQVVVTVFRQLVRDNEARIVE